MFNPQLSSFNFHQSPIVYKKSEVILPSQFEQLIFKDECEAPASNYLYWNGSEFSIGDRQNLVIDFKHYSDSFCGKVEDDLLIRSLGKVSPENYKIVDGTCGLARDTLKFLWAGYRVDAYEESPELAVLLHQAYDKNPYKKLNFFFKSFEKADFDFYNSNSILYLDPMYGDSLKKAKALPSKEMQFLRELLPQKEFKVSPFLKATFDRVVVKRNLKAKKLDMSPTYSLKGKNVRFDVFKL